MSWYITCDTSNYGIYDIYMYTRVYTGTCVERVGPRDGRHTANVHVHVDTVDRTGTVHSYLNIYCIHVHVYACRYIQVTVVYMYIYVCL